MKINVGFTKKVGEPNFGSRGAAVHLELELDAATAEDAELVRQRVRQLFVQVKSAVHDELAQAEPRCLEQTGPARNAASRRNRPATPAQLKALARIADRWQFDLPAWLFERFGTGDPAELTVGQASELIDELRGDRLVERRT
jgi:hypothetical protein